MSEFKADIDRFGRAHSGIRNPAACQYAVIHTTENSDTTPAVNVADWQLNTANGSSYNLLVGTDGTTVRSNSDRFTPWSAGSPANQRGLHVSAIGYAARNRDHWMRFPRQLESIAAILRDWHHRHGIPLVWLSPADINAGRRGVTSHANIYQAYRSGAFRSDPGPGFPHEHVLQLARTNPQEGFLMALSDAEQRELLAKTRDIHRELTQRYPSRSAYRAGDGPVDTLAGMVLNVDARVHEDWVHARAAEEGITPDEFANRLNSKES